MTDVLGGFSQAYPATPVHVGDTPPPGSIVYTDYPAFREYMISRVFDSLRQVKPVENDRFVLSVEDVALSPKRPTVKDEEEAVKKGLSLGVPVKGRFVLTERGTGVPVAKTAARVLMRIPWFTNDGHFVANGVPYTFTKQFRMSPGVYTRQASDGSYEAQVNVEQGTGSSFKISLDDRTGVFRARLGGTNIPLYHFLKQAGISDESMKNAWGKDLFDKNMKQKPPTAAVSWMNRMLESVAARGLREGVEYQDDASKARAFLSRMRLSPEVTHRLMGVAYENVSPELMLHASRRVLNTSRGDEEADSRDNPSNQFVFDAGDQLATYLALDRGGVLRNALWKLRNDPSRLEKIRPALFQQHVDHLINGSGVANVPDQISPIDAYDQTFRITRLGEGAISSLDSAPDEARDVQPGYMNFVDPLRAPECYSADMEVRTRQGWKRWDTVTVEDELACRAEGKLQFSRPEAVQRYWIRSDLYGMENATVSYLVTWNHRMWVKSGDTGTWSFVFAGDLAGQTDARVDVSESCQEILAELKETDGDPGYFSEPYVGFVYCATVPGGLLYVRRNGRCGFWCGNSLKIGLDMFLSRRAVKGPDNRLYAPFKDIRTGKTVWLNPVQVETENIAGPGETASGKKFVTTMSPKYGIRYLPVDKVKYEVISGDDFFSSVSDSIPMKAGVKGMRQLMGSKFLRHALPLTNGEAPLVQTVSADGRPSALVFGGACGAAFAEQDGVVQAVGDRAVQVKYADGTEKTVPFYRWKPYQTKTSISQKAVVEPGQKVKKGQPMVISNFTTPSGELALSRNLRVAYMPYYSQNFEDAIVLSESAAKKLTSQHTYKVKFDRADDIEVDRKKFLASYPMEFAKEQLDRIDDRGVVKPGTTLHYGDPMYLAVKTMPASELTLGRRQVRNVSKMWDHHMDGLVRDVVNTKNGWRVFVDVVSPLQVGDKVSIPFGGKGLVSIIKADDDMPRGEDGRPLEMIISPLSVISRANPAQITVAALGKAAERTGKPYVLPGAMDQDFAEFADRELKKVGMSNTETLFNPVSGKQIEKVFTGILPVYKLQQLGESKGKARDTGSYTIDDTPARGGSEGSKHFGQMEYDALRSHGVPSIIRDQKLIKGQANPDFWRQVKMGGTPVIPQVPSVYGKFKDLIRASGVTLKEDEAAGDTVFAATDKDIQALTGDREIRTSETYNKRMEPIPGGLFDPRATGSLLEGDRFAYFKLPEPMLNPLMEAPFRTLLDMTGKEFDEMQAEGPEEVRRQLSNIRPDEIIADAKRILKDAPGTSKADKAAKRMMYAEALRRHDVKPEDFLMTRVPVLPPKHRRITQQDGMTMVPDLNYLYRQLMFATGDFAETKALGGQPEKEARAAMVQAYRELVGTEKPVSKEFQKKGIGGIIQQITGKGSPKFSLTRRRVLDSDSDLTGLSPIIPDAGLKLDEVGVPWQYAWKVFNPFVIRNLVTQGVPAVRALQEVKMETPLAREALLKAMSDRFLLVNRAPTLHKHGIMALKARPVSGNALRVNPQVVGPYAGDFDGNCVDFAERIILRLTKAAVTLFDPVALTRAEVSLDSSEPDSSVLHEGVYELPIGMFPRTGQPMKDRNGADVYNVPAGVESLSYDILTGKAVFAPVTHFTVEKGAECSEVKYGARRIVVSSNPSLAVFDHETGLLKKSAPAESVGLYTPRITSIPAERGMYGDFSWGWWVGVFVSDGWYTDRMVGHAKLSEAIRARFKEITLGRFSVKVSVHEYREESGPTRFGKGIKVHYGSTGLASIVKAFGFVADPDAETGGRRKALRKQIPSWMLAQGSEDFLWGVVSGLLDGDSCLNVNKVKKLERYQVRFNTSSPYLKDDIVHLFLRLGIVCAVTETPARGKSARSWVVCPAAPDMQRKIDKVRCEDPDTAEFFKAYAARVYDDRKRPTDLVPLTFAEAAGIKAEALAAGQRSIYSGLSKSRTRPHLQRDVLQEFLASRKESEYTELRLRVFSEVRWAAVQKATDAGVRDVFDLAVEGTKVIALAGGMVVYDTMSYTPTVSREATEEARLRMTPGANLLSPGTNKPAYKPTQEPLAGLYLLSKEADRTRPAKTFLTEDEAVEAFRKGEISVDSPVRIVGRS